MVKIARQPVMKKVDFIIGGVQKAGTSALFEYLLRHPELSGAAGKETHFFDDETAVDWQAPNYKRYHAFYSARDRAKLWFEATPIYIFWPDSLVRIKAYRPGMKFIFLFRDPIERAWSHWCMEYGRRAETLDFKSAIRAGRSRLHSWAPTAPAWRVFSYVERGFYAGQIARCLALFPRGQILYLASEDLLNHPELTLRRVTDFLGVSPFRAVERIASNVRSKQSYPSVCGADDLTYLRNVFSSELERFEALTGLDISNWPSRTGIPSSALTAG